MLKRSPPMVEDTLVRIDGEAIPLFADDMQLDNLSVSIAASLTYLNRLPSTRKFKYGKDTFDVQHLIYSMEIFQDFITQAPAPGALQTFIHDNYWVYKSIGQQDTGEVLFTGYYEPLLNGSLKKEGIYQYPVFQKPKDLMQVDLSKFSDHFKGQRIIGRIDHQTLVPYYDRQAIQENDTFIENAEPLAFLADPIDLFFLQIQGSGKIYLKGGEIINVHYHVTNGRPYRSIGKFLIQENAIPKSEMSMQRIRSYLKANPNKADQILNYNPSYVFFKKEADGPLGCLNVVLTPGRSIATDRKVFPAAGLAFIRTQKPLVSGRLIHKWMPFSRFVMNQDTGGAINGPGRVDLFWGNGPYAEISAGHMQHPGELYFLVLAPEPPLGDVRND